MSLTHDYWEETTLHLVAWIQKTDLRLLHNLLTCVHGAQGVKMPLSSELGGAAAFSGHKTTAQ